MPTDNYGFEALRTTANLIRQGKSATKPDIRDLSLSQLKEKETTFLKWYNTATDEDEKTVQKHIYEHYLLPRIEELEKGLV